MTSPGLGSPGLRCILSSFPDGPLYLVSRGDSLRDARLCTPGLRDAHFCTPASSINPSDVSLAPILADCHILRGLIEMTLVWFRWEGVLILLVTVQAASPPVSQRAAPCWSNRDGPCSVLGSPVASEMFLYIFCFARMPGKKP